MAEHLVGNVVHYWGGPGLEPTADTTAESPSGPASFMVTDPDGNVILIDEHV